jgi:hypothetical protein
MVLDYPTWSSSAIDLIEASRHTWIRLFLKLRMSRGPHRMAQINIATRSVMKGGKNDEPEKTHG